MKTAEFFDLVIKGSKALIVFSIALFFVRCSMGAMIPDVNIDGFADGDEIKIEVIENEGRETVTIRKNGEDILVVEGDKHGD